jgi:hypothetical protein
VVAGGSAAGAADGVAASAPGSGGPGSGSPPAADAVADANTSAHITRETVMALYLFTNWRDAGRLANLPTVLRMNDDVDCTRVSLRLETTILAGQLQSAAVEKPSKNSGRHFSGDAELATCERRSPGPSGMERPPKVDIGDKPHRPHINRMCAHRRSESCAIELSAKSHPRSSDAWSLLCTFR